MGDRPESDIVDTAGVVVFLEVRHGFSHAVGDIKSNFPKQGRAPINTGPVFLCDKYNKFHLRLILAEESHCHHCADHDSHCMTYCQSVMDGYWI